MNTFTKLLVFTFNFIFLLVSSFAQVEPLDASFGQDGIVRSYFYGNTATATSTAVQPDGKILIAGYFYEKIGSETSQDFVVLRLNSNGSLDYSFGEEGKVSTDFSISTPGILNDYATDMALQPDGKIIVVGYTYLNGYAIMARYNDDGSLDTSFGAGGKVRTAATDIEEIYQITISSVGLQSDGKIIAAGKAHNHFTLARYNTDGALDLSFGTNGIIHTDFGGRSEISDIVIQSNGKITAGGHVYESFNYKFALARYNSDGMLDAGFGTNGKVTTDFGFDSSQNRYNRDEIRSIVYQNDEKLIAFGRSGSQDRLATFVSVRYNLDGSIDTSFGENGVITTSSSDNRWMAKAAILQPDNKLLALGNFTNGDDTGFALARYHLYGATVGINKQINKPNNSIEVYPNPSSGIFSVRTSQHAISKIKVFNVLGQEIQSQTVSFVNGEIISVDLSRENKGVYFLYLETDFGRGFIEKIVIE